MVGFWGEIRPPGADKSAGARASEGGREGGREERESLVLHELPAFCSQLSESKVLVSD